ncbi:MAG: aminoglycoside phosphotransferase [Desulfuromonadales bacterium]
MRYEQMRTVLQQLAPNYHRKVSSHFQDLADGEVSPRVRLMLDYLIDHELHRALALGEFCHGARHHVLDHWFKGLEINFPEARADILGDAARTDLDQLVKAAVEYKKNLVSYFAYLSEHCSDKETSHLILTLKTQEEKAMKRMIRHAQGLADL